MSDANPLPLDRAIGRMRSIGKDYLGVMLSPEEALAVVAEVDRLRAAAGPTVPAMSGNNLPDRLVAAREAKQWSQADLATRTGFQPSAVSHFETGRRVPTVANLVRLADVLGVSIDWLVGRLKRPA